MGISTYVGRQFAVQAVHVLACVAQFALQPFHFVGVPLLGRSVQGRGAGQQRRGASVGWNGIGRSRSVGGRATSACASTDRRRSSLDM